MFRAGLNDFLFGSATPPRSAEIRESGAAPLTDRVRFDGRAVFDEASARPRRTPRKSLIVVIPENHIVPHELVDEGMPATGDEEAVHVIVACAGRPANLAALQRKVRDVQVLLVPPGTSTETLREIAIKQAPGDIVTLRSGLWVGSAIGDRETSSTV